MARKAKICGLDSEHGVPVYSHRSYRKFLRLLAAMIAEGADEGMDPATFVSYVRSVRDRLTFFLEMIDRCDVLFSEKEGARLVFLVLTDNEEHLPLIASAIAQEKRLLDKLGIDSHAVDVHGDKIRVSVPMPDASSHALH
jgi:hypothetical protein